MPGGEKPRGAGRHHHRGNCIGTRSGPDAPLGLSGVCVEKASPELVLRGLRVSGVASPIDFASPRSEPGGRLGSLSGLWYVNISGVTLFPPNLGTGKCSAQGARIATMANL